MQPNDPTAAAEWPKPDVGFITGTELEHPAPPFPVEVLGPFWASYVRATAIPRTTPDFVAMSLLGTAAGLIGNSRAARFPGTTHVVPANLWTFLVGDPSSGKSIPIKPLMAMVDDIEEEEEAAFSLADTTVAGAIELHEDQPHGVLILKDELSAWWDSFKRDRGGEQFWLEGWNGDLPYKVRRRKRSVHIRRFNVSVAGGTQPETLKTMLEATSGIERGFFARCYFTFPNKPKGGQSTSDTLPDLKAARKALGSLFGLQGSGLDPWKPIEIPFSRTAANYHERWWSNIEATEMIDAKRQEGQWLLKQYGSVARLALVLECLWWSAAGTTGPNARVRERVGKLLAVAQDKRGDENTRAIAEERLREYCAAHGLDADDIMKGGQGFRARDPKGPQEVSADAMRAACKLVWEYLHPHMVRCIEYAYPPVVYNAAKDFVNALVAKDITHFNARAVQKNYNWISEGGKPTGKINTWLHKTPLNMEEVCEYLAERQVIRRVVSAKTGRKPTDYAVNPLLREAILGPRARRPALT